MATCRRTATNENISTYGNATRGYTSLSTWEAEKGDLDMVAASQSEVLECYDDAASFDDYVTIFGATTNENYFPIIRSAAGQGHDGTPNNGFNIHNTSVVDVFRAEVEHLQIQDIVVKSVIPDTDTTGRTCIYSKSVGTTIIGCIVYDSYHAGAGANMTGILTRADHIKVIDCIVINTRAASGVGRGFRTIGVYDITYCNCTSVNNDDGFYSVSSALTAKNCAASGNVIADWDGTVTKTTCTTEGATPVYKNAANNDFHLASSDTVCRDNGTDLSGDATFAFDDDIDGELWGPAWSIGFDQFSADDGIWTANPWADNPWE